MTTDALTAEDHALIETARDIIRARYIENRHHIAAVLRTRSGKVHVGLHLDTYVGRASVCAEAVAVGTAMAAGDRDIVAIVSVRHPRPSEANQTIQVVSPCGICREMLTDFAAGAAVILLRDDAHVRIPVEELLPAKYKRHP